MSFFTFPVASSVHVLNHNIAGLTINPVYGLISQQPGPIKMCQATRYPWSYIRNYNRIHYQCSYTSPIPLSEGNLLFTQYYIHEILQLHLVIFAVLITPFVINSLHVNTRYELVLQMTIHVYTVYNIF